MSTSAGLRDREPLNIRPSRSVTFLRVSTGRSDQRGRSVTPSNSPACRSGSRFRSRRRMGPLQLGQGTSFYRQCDICPERGQQLAQPNKHLPADLGFGREVHPGTYSRIEHPGRDLAVVALIVIPKLATVAAFLATPPSANDYFLSVQPVPRIVNPPRLGLVIILVGTCTIFGAHTSPWRRTPPRPGQSSHRGSAAWSPSPRSEASTATPAAQRSFASVMGPPSPTSAALAARTDLCPSRNHRRAPASSIRPQGG